MISRSQIAFVRSLKDRNVRSGSGLFLAEGVKLVSDLLTAGLEAVNVYSLPDYASAFRYHAGMEEISAAQMERITALKSPSPVMGIFRIPKPLPLHNIDFSKEWALFADGIADPGNFGTLIRTADWFGIRHCLCTPNGVDAFNPKSVQASMGSVSRVSIHTVDPVAFFNGLPPGILILGTDMTGHNIYSEPPMHGGILVMGSEASGIGDSLRSYINRWVTVPPWDPAPGQHPESLNVATASALILSEIRRKLFTVQGVS